MPRLAWSGHRGLATFLATSARRLRTSAPPPDRSGPGLLVRDGRLLATSHAPYDAEREGSKRAAPLPWPPGIAEARKSGYRSIGTKVRACRR
jgi:hypothetical protein